MPIQAISPSGQSVFDFAREGMRSAEKRLEGAAVAISRGDISSSRMVDLIVSERMYEANARVVRTQSEMLGTLLDVRR